MAVENAGRIESVDTASQLPRAKAAKCLGEACASFSGIECASSKLILTRMNGEPIGEDVPHVSDVSDALYVQVCLDGEPPEVVQTQVEIFAEGPDMRDLVAQSPHLPINIVDHNLPPHIEPASPPQS